MPGRDPEPLLRTSYFRVLIGEQELGFAEDQARVLAVETFVGAAKLAAASTEPPAALRARVTSKGGTTERALEVMESCEMKVRVVDAVRAAARRSRELGDEFGSN